MGKLIKNNFFNFLAILLIVVLLIGWGFTGWPQLLEFRIQNLEFRVPPEIKEI